MQRFLIYTLLLLTAPFWPAFAAAPDMGAGGDLNCVILPDEQVELSSPVPGVIEAVLVRRSERVTRGQVLARLESSVEAATVALAGAREQTSAEAGLRRVELGYDAQHRNRLRALHTREAVSAQIREDAERVAAVARLRLRLAEDRRHEAMLERRRADAVLALKTIKSPIDGVVVERLRTVGEYVEDRPILRIARLDPLRVEVIAPLALFGRVHEGMQIAVRPETDPEHERVATVSAVDAVADPGSGTFGVQLTLPNPDLVLPAGIKCKGRLLSRVAGDVVKPARSDVAMAAGPASTDAAVAKISPLSGPQAGSESAPEVTEEVDAVFVPEVAEEVGAVFVAEVVAEVGSSPAPELAPPVAPEFEPGLVDAPAVEVHTATAPGACLTFEPLDSVASARALARAAERLGARAQVRTVNAQRVIGYMVVIAVAPHAESRPALEAVLRAAGISDFALISHGDYAGRISLGIYKGPLSAERRRAALAKRGFVAEVLPRTRQRRAWQVALDLDAGLDPERVRAELAGREGIEIAQTDDCEPLLTAAR